MPSFISIRILQSAISHRSRVRLFLPLVVAAGCAGGPPAAPPAGVTAAVFVCDATPPPGHPLCGGWIRSVEAVDDPLLLKGVVLDDGRTRCVLAAIDWCRLQTETYGLFRRRLAEGAGVPESRVALHALHQHNAPIADAAAQRLLDGVPGGLRHLDVAWAEDVARRAGEAARAAVARRRPVTHAGWGEARVEGFASNRRSVVVDGRILWRGSATTDPRLQSAPDGPIDPLLRTVTLFDGDAAVVRLHFYASHPQSFYGDGRVTSDTAGLARERREREEGVPQIYFTGCAGDVAAGKYNDGTPAARERLTGRLHAAMREASAATRREPAAGLDWRTAEVRLPLRTEPEFAEDALRRTLADAGAPPAPRIKAALALAWIAGVRARPAVDVTRLRIGSIDILGLPGEAFVEYQLHAGRLRAGGRLAVAAYGECGPGYVCTDRALDAGAYEPTMSLVGPGGEAALKAAIGEALK